MVRDRGGHARVVALVDCVLHSSTSGCTTPCCLPTADPAFTQQLDDRIRAAHGPESSTMTGTIDSCGWPVSASVITATTLYCFAPSVTPSACRWLRQRQAKTPAQAPASLQWTRATQPFYDDFRNGLYGASSALSLLLLRLLLLLKCGMTNSPSALTVCLYHPRCWIRQSSNWVVPTGYKACCSPHLTENVNIVTDTVNGESKPVLALTAVSIDNPGTCKPGQTCSKFVRRHAAVPTSECHYVFPAHSFQSGSSLS
jgi:hypothetical protein